MPKISVNNYKLERYRYNYFNAKKQKKSYHNSKNYFISP